MRAFIKDFFRFVLPAFFVYTLFSLFLLPIILSKTNGPSTREQIHQSMNQAIKTNYNLLILGNSRLYRGINPDRFSIKAYNFSHDDDTYNQIYYKLCLLLDRNKEFKYLLLGVDYFQFSFISEDRNHIYGSLLGDGYLKDYKSNYILQEIKYRIGFLKPDKLKAIGNTEIRPFLKENGQYIKSGIAKKNDQIVRKSNRLKIQVEYFEKIISKCKENKIRLFLLIMPIRKNEIESYKESNIVEFNRFINSYSDENVCLFDFSKDTGYTMIDFSDITHLNEKSADRFSSQLNDSINTILSK